MIFYALFFPLTDLIHTRQYHVTIVFVLVIFHLFTKKELIFLLCILKLLGSLDLHQRTSLAPSSGEINTIASTLQLTYFTFTKEQNVRSIDFVSNTQQCLGCLISMETALKLLTLSPSSKLALDFWL